MSSLSQLLECVLEFDFFFVLISNMNNINNYNPHKQTLFGCLSASMRNTVVGDSVPLYRLPFPHLFSILLAVPH